MSEKIDENILEEKLQGIVMRILHCEDKKSLFGIERETAGHQWSSLKHAELILSLKDEFKVNFSLFEILDIQRYSDIKKIVFRELGKET